MAVRGRGRGQTSVHRGKLHGKTHFTLFLRSWGGAGPYSQSGQPGIVGHTQSSVRLPDAQESIRGHVKSQGPRAEQSQGFYYSRAYLQEFELTIAAPRIAPEVPRVPTAGVHPVELTIYVPWDDTL